jgi:hypothetical protein
MWQPDIVMIEKCYVSSTRVTDTEIARSAYTPILATRVFQISHSGRMRFSVTTGDFAAPISRGIVDEYELPSLKRLSEHAFDGLGQKLNRVPDGHDDGHVG